MVRGDVEIHAATLRCQAAPPRRWRWVRQRPLSRILEKCRRDLRSPFTTVTASARARGLARRMVGALQLMIPGGLLEQIVACGRAVVRRGYVDPQHRLLAIALEARAQFQACDTFPA